MMAFCGDSIEKIKPELKNPFPTFFINVFGKLIPRVCWSQLDLRFFCKGFSKSQNFRILRYFARFPTKINDFEDFLLFFTQNIKIPTFCTKMFSKMRSELKNLFLTFFWYVFGRLIPGVYRSQLDLRFFCRGFQNLRIFKAFGGFSSKM